MRRLSDHLRSENAKLEERVATYAGSRSWALTKPLRRPASASGRVGAGESATSAVCIVSASGQNVFFEEMLAAVESALAANGVVSERAVDHFPPPRDGVAYLSIPHEYVPLVASAGHPSPAHLARSVALCTEQPGTQWFDKTAAIAARSARAVDVNQVGVGELRRRGVAAEFLQLGYVPEWDRWGGDDSRSRPVDVSFMGEYTQRRAEALARCAPVLADRRASLHLFESALPHTADSQSFLSGERKWNHLASARTIVNVHRSELGYCEWQRFIGAMSNGCVVLSEHSLGAAPFVAGEHFVSFYPESLPQVLRALLDDEERLAEMRLAAYRLLKDELPMTRTVGVLAEALAQAASAPLNRAELRQSMPAPKAAPARLPEYVRLARHRGELDRALMALKQIFLGQRELHRRIAELQDGQAEDRVERLGPHTAGEPRVSVLLTSHNYKDVVAKAIRSVALSGYRDHELVVVDDASTDGSAAVIEAELSRYPWLPVQLIVRGRNRGLAAARNLATQHARGEYVFILDADNFVYPHALGRLVDALDRDPGASFAYGILEVFTSQGATDLKSWLDWDPQRLRYGNFVDAMSMIRRSALEEAGGYSSDPRLYGWEDFALWCALAEREQRGVLVPEILAAYRSSIGSMIALTDIDASAAWSALLDRHAILHG